MEDVEILRIEIVVFPDEGRPSMFAEDAYPSIETLDQYAANPSRQRECARKLGQRGFTIDHIGRFSISASVHTTIFQTFFGTELVVEDLGDGRSGVAPRPDGEWHVPEDDGLDKIIERAYVQRPPLYMAGERPIPPLDVPPNNQPPTDFRLRVPDDVAVLMRAKEAHRKGITGKGITVAMPDNGFFEHPFFKAHGCNFLAVPAPDVTNPATDHSGHGTGIAANLFAVAPDVNFIGVKQDNKTLGFKTAVEMRPDIITCSWAAELENNSATMPNNLKPFHLAVLDAIGQGIVVCVAAGNEGMHGFPGNMPEVISVGGVHVGADLVYQASSLTSGFGSTWFPGRRTPDVCGLSGLSAAERDYIVMPVPQTAHGGGVAREGWYAFSGSSSSTPMVAGVCALLKQAKGSLTPSEIRNLLKFTATDIVNGINSDGNSARPGPDEATGFGLVDAARALAAIT